jgi:para-aminobenzoate synthetase/4-amino-4-deoxychorismate lyase
MSPISRPDPRRGVFETLLVLDGRPVEAEAHLARLAASLEALFGAGLPAAAREMVGDRAAGRSLARLRLTVTPAGTGLACETATEAVDPALLFPAWDRGAELRGLRFEGGLGAHKWADRSPLPRAEDGTVPLLMERDGEVLETSRANLFAARDGALFTPPADGRILPGIARAASIALARGAGLEVAERRVDRDELLAAEEVFLTGSVRGLEPVRSLDGTALGADRTLSRAIAAGLRRRWRLRSAAAGAAEPAAGQPLGPPAR